jgi:hypothetical protein
LQWLFDPSEINGDNLNNVRREASRYSRNKNKEYLKDKINELATNSKTKNIRDPYRGINELKKDLQPRKNLVKDEMAICFQISTTFKIGEELILLVTECT